MSKKLIIAGTGLSVIGAAFASLAFADIASTQSASMLLVGGSSVLAVGVAIFIVGRLLES